MARRILGEHFRKDGQPKKKFTKTDAQEAAIHRKQKSYECSFCGHYHLARMT